MSPLSVKSLSPMKKSSCLNQERNIMHRSSENLLFFLYVRDNSKALLWIMNSYFSRKQVKLHKWWICLTNMQLFASLTDGLEWCGLLWCFYQLSGLSFWRHPFTAEHPLVSKWWNATFLQIFQMKKQTHLHLRCKCSHFIFRWTIPLSGEP